MVNIPQGLFGTDPAITAQAYQGALQANAIQNAQMSPVQAARASMFRAGSQLGGLGANLLGIKDPELEAQSLMQQTAKTLDLKDHAAVRNVANEWMKSGNTTLQNKAVQLNELADRTEEANNQRIKEKVANDLAVRKAERQAKFSEEYNLAPDTEGRLAVTRKYAEMPDLIKMDEAAVARKEKYDEAKRNDERDAENRRALQAERLAAQAFQASESRAARAAVAAEGRANRVAAKVEGDNYKATLAQEKINAADEKQRDADAKASRSAQGSLSHAAEMIKNVTEAKNLVKFETTGRTGQVAAAINPGGEAGTLRNRIANIKANIGFDRLQKMREESPTGGALGQVAVQELEALQDSIANLSPLQNDAELKNSFDRVIKHYKGWQGAVQEDEAARVKRRVSPRAITLPTATQRDARPGAAAAPTANTPSANAPSANAPTSGWGKAVVN